MKGNSGTNVPFIHLWMLCCIWFVQQTEAFYDFGQFRKYLGHWNSRAALLNQWPKSFQNCPLSLADIC